jgi:hypothetical protein
MGYHVIILILGLYKVKRSSYLAGNCLLIGFESMLPYHMKLEERMSDVIRLLDC